MLWGLTLSGADTRRNSQPSAGCRQTFSRTTEEKDSVQIISLSFSHTHTYTKTPPRDKYINVTFLTYNDSGALCFAELGTMIHKSGGEFSYLMESLGPVPAFISVWTGIVMAKTSSQAIIALSFAQYVLTPLFDACGPPQLLLKLLAAAVICECLKCLHLVTTILIRECRKNKAGAS